jgi:hypothetical protein
LSHFGRARIGKTRFRASSEEIKSIDNVLTGDLIRRSRSVISSLLERCRLGVVGFFANGRERRIIDVNLLLRKVRSDANNENQLERWRNRIRKRNLTAA